MDFKKIFTSKTGVAIVFVVITVLAVLGFSVICKRGGSYMFKDSRGEVKENFQSGEKVLDLSEKDNVKIINGINGMSVYSKKYYEQYIDKDLNGYYVFDDVKYYFVFDLENNSISVDNSQIFKSDGDIVSINLYKDFIGLKIEKSNSYNLELIDLKGNTIKNISDISYVSFLSDLINYSYRDSYVVKENEIYESHSVPTYVIKYLGNLEFSVEAEDYSIPVYTTDCTDGSYCKVYDKDNLKIEFISDNYEHKNINSHYSLVINGNNVEVGAHLSSIIQLSDGYLLISSSFQDGYSKFISLVDRNGNVVVEFGDYMMDDEYVSYNLVSGDKEYNNGEIIIYSVIPGNFDKYYEDSCSAINDDKSTVIGRKRVFKYLGNGKVDDQIIVKNITLGDWVTQLNCEQR